MDSIIKLWVVVVTLTVTLKLFRLWWQQQNQRPKLSRANKIKLALSGILANMADTIGVGSFAVLIALNKHASLVDDQELPGTLNAHSPLPAMCQALFFLQVVHVELITLMSLIIGASIGGFLGGFVVANLNKQRIRSLMLMGYLGIAAIILGCKAGLLPIGGTLIALQGPWLIMGFIGMLASGILPAIGVGSYAPIQVILFLLGMSPLAAFPIMTAAAAIQQSVAALAFIQRGQFALQASCLLGLAGVVGVIIAAPIVTLVNPESLRWVLLSVVLYNVFMLWNDLKSKPMPMQHVSS